MAILPETLPIDSGDRSAQSHRDWLADMLATIEDLLFASYALFGGANGIKAYGPTGDVDDILKVQALGTPGLQVEVLPGLGFIEGNIARMRSTFTSDTIDVPITNPRRDLVQLALDGRTIVVKEGTEHATPTLPTVDANCIRLAEIYCRVGMGSIEDADDASNGYIIDLRDFL